MENIEKKELFKVGEIVGNSKLEKAVRCLKCNFITKDIQNFFEHIKQKHPFTK